MKKIGKAITCILIILLLVGALGFLLRFTNGGTSELRTFYVKNGKTLYTLSVGNYSFAEGDELRFDVRYTFAASDDVKGYSATIVPNVTDDTEFEYTVDDGLYIYSDDLDLSSAFGMERHETYFTFTIPLDITMESVLSSVYPTESVTVPDDVNVQTNYYFALIVKSYDGSDSVRINFRIESIRAVGIEFDVTHIAF